VLQQRRLKKEILSEYLIENGISMSQNDKEAMVTRILQMWYCTPHEELILSFLDLQ
jgi:hypothetical protein